MQLIHRKCGGNILIDIQKLIKIYADVTISSNSMIITRIVLFRTGKKYISPEFSCAKCSNEEVDGNDVIVRCYNCENLIEFKKILMPKKSGGIYCKSCYESHFKEEGYTSRTELKIIVSRLADSR